MRRLLTIIRIRVEMRRMYICMCNAVTDHDIRRAAADGLSTFDELQEQTGCGNCCGCCESEARRVLHQAIGRGLHIQTALAA